MAINGFGKLHPPYLKSSLALAFWAVKHSMTRAPGADGVCRNSGRAGFRGHRR
jgi:hypothetical protein